MTSEDSVAATCDKLEAMKTASDLLAQGKRNMVCGEVPKAVGLYEEAVQLLVKSCGEMSRDCADAYYCCGSALLELGRMETNVLGVALEGVAVEEEKEEEEASEQFEKPPAEEGEERQKLRVEVYEAMAEGEREEEFQKVLEKTKETIEKEEIQKVLPGKTDVTSVEEGKEEIQKVLPEKTDVTSVDEGKEEIQKVLPGKTDVTSVDEGKEEIQKVLPEKTQETSAEEEGKEELQKVLPEKTPETSAEEEGKEELQKVLPEKTQETSEEEGVKEELPKVLPEKTEETQAEEEGKEELQKVLPEKTQETSAGEEGKEELQKVLPEKTKETSTEEEGKEESQKVLPEKTQETPAEDLDVCDKSVAVANMETDAVTEKGEDIAVNKGEVIDEQSSNNAGSKEEKNVSVSTKDESTPEEKTDNCHAGHAQSSEGMDSSTADNKCEDESASTMDVCKPDKIDGTEAEVAEKCKPDKIDGTQAEKAEKCTSNEETQNVCALASTEEKVVAAAVGSGNITDVCESNAAVDQDKNVNATDESVPEEIMDTTENVHVTEKSGSSTEGDKETDLVAAESKQEEVISDSTAENGTVAEESGSGAENMKVEGSLSTSEGDKSKQEEETKFSEQGEKQVIDKSDNAEELKDAEKVETEAVIDGDKKMESQETGTGLQDSSVHAESQDKILADDTLGPSKVEENADVEMADNDEMDVSEDEDDDVTTDDIQENEGNEDEKEEVPNFQLAWEYLDLAKVLYLKSDTADDQLKAAECHMKLGELSIETGQLDTAAEDLGCALKIQQKYLPANDRLIASTFYQLGLACGMRGEYEQSIQHYTQATGVIESKIESLNKLVLEKEANGENKENAELGECGRYLAEIKELQELIPELKNKVEDTNQEAKDMEQMKNEFVEALTSRLSKATGSPTKHNEATLAANGAVLDVNAEDNKVSDISHMVRKKRKNEADVSDTDALETKKIKADGDCSNTAALNRGTSQLETNNIVEGCSLKQNEDGCALSVEPVA